MAHSLSYRVTSEVFVVPHEDLLILYAPLKGVVAAINEATAALLRDLAPRALQSRSAGAEYGAAGGCAS